MRCNSQTLGRIYRRKGGEIIEKLKVIELFSGLGSQTQALKNIGVDHEVVAVSEIDKYAIKSYESLHGTANNLGDICNIEELPKADLWTYSFPCTDISVAGKLQGFEKGSGTRSGLLWEVERLLIKAKENGTLPKYLLLENVKNLIGKNFKADYDKWLAFLCDLGYSNYYKVLNAKHYGIPQNRERVFCVSILGEHKPYEFPEPRELTLRLRDMLEENVEERFYITRERALAMINSHYVSRRNSVVGDAGITPTICARDWKEPKCVVLGSLEDEKYAKMHESSRRVHSVDGIAPTVHTCGGGNTEPKIIYEEPLDREGWHRKAKEVINSDGICTCITGQSNNLLQKITEPKIAAMRGRNPDNPSDRTSGAPTEQRLEFNNNGTSNTITTVQKDNLVVCEERSDEGLRFFKDGCCGALRTKEACGDKRVLEASGVYTGASPRFQRPPIEELSRTLKAISHDAGVKLTDKCGVRIRKLTPTECLRLMGWNAEQIAKIKSAGISNTQMYKQAGNGIVVQVLEEIFRKLFKE